MGLGNLTNLISSMQSFNQAEEIENLKLKYHDHLITMTEDDQNSFLNDKLAEVYEQKTGLKVSRKE